VILGDDSILEDILFKGQKVDFNDDWNEIQTHYSNLVKKMQSSSDYTDFFGNFNLRIKTRIDSLISDFSSGNQELVNAYQSLAYMELIRYMGIDFIPSAFMTDISAYKDLNEEQTNKNLEFLQRLDNDIKNSTNFIDVKRAFKEMKFD
jgi:hypothetical protein